MPLEYQSNPSHTSDRLAESDGKSESEISYLCIFLVDEVDTENVGAVWKTSRLQNTTES